MRQINVLFYIILSVTLFLMAIHVRRIIYFENPSKEITEKIYSGQVIISTHLTSNRDEYTFNCSFNHIKSDIVIKNLNIELIKRDKVESSTLNLTKVLPYSGMHNWDIPEFVSFAKIPESLKALNASNNPYFAYDFVFNDDVKNQGDKFIAKISANIIERDKEKLLTKELTILRKSKLVIRPWDAHSDGSFLLIPITGFVTLVLFLVKLLAFIKRKQRAATIKEAD